MPFVLAMRGSGLGLGDAGVQINLWLHVLGSLVVLGLLRVPALADWVDGRLT